MAESTRAVAVSRRPYRRHEPGEVFGRVTLVARLPKVNGNGYWLCVCECGRELRAQIGQLTSGRTVSCGKKACNPAFKAVPTYLGAHGRIWRERGPARNRACVDCGKRAAEWSYDGTDPEELVEPEGPRAGLPYSLDASRYQPRCRSCHRRFDHTRRRNNIRPACGPCNFGSTRAVGRWEDEESA